MEDEGWVSPCLPSLWLKSINSSCFFNCKINTLLQYRHTTTTINNHHSNAHKHRPPSPPHAFGRLWTATYFCPVPVKCFLDVRMRRCVKSSKRDTQGNLPAFLLSWIGGCDLAGTAINHSNPALLRPTAAQLLVGCPQSQLGKAKGALVEIHRLRSGRVAPLPVPLHLLTRTLPPVWTHSTLKFQSNAPSIEVFVERWADSQRRGVAWGDRGRTDCSPELKAPVTRCDQKTRQTTAVFKGGHTWTHPQKVEPRPPRGQGGRPPLRSQCREGAPAWEVVSS